MAKIERPMKPDYFPVFPMHLLMDEEFEGLDRAEWGSVFLLMQHQWIKDGTLPADTRKLAAMAKCSEAELETLRARWPKLQPVAGQPDRVAIPWLLNEYQRAMAAWEAFRDQQVENGRKSAEARREKHGSAQPKRPEPDPEPLPYDGSNHGSNDGSDVVRTIPEPPSHPIPSLTIRKEEEPIGSSSAEAPSAPAAPVAELPCVGSKGLVYRVAQEQVAGWQRAFPGVDVQAELQKAKAWLDANPTRRKTHQGTPRFIVSWLSRQQDQPKAYARGEPAKPSPRAASDKIFTEQLKAHGVGNGKPGGDGELDPELEELLNVRRAPA